jgi:hypothetical protein
MSEFNLPTKLENILPEQHQNNGYVEKIKNTIAACSSDISNTSKGAAQLNANGGGWFKKGENIREIAGYVVTLSSVQQRTLDMVVLLMGAAGRMKTDYNVILESIEELSKSHSESVDVLEYLVKIKNMVNEIKRRDEFLDSLINYSNELRNSIEELNSNFQKEIKSILQSSEDLNSRQKVISEELSAIKLFVEKEKKYNQDKFGDMFNDIELKNKLVLDAIKNVENSFLSKLEDNSAVQLKNLSDLDISLKEQIEDVVNNQKIINENMFYKIDKYFKIAIVSVIILALSTIAIIIFK